MKIIFSNKNSDKRINEINNKDRDNLLIQLVLLMKRTFF